MTSTDQVKFSICIPAYKSSYLKECIQSILNQTCQDFELIVLNDNSPQPVEEIVLEFDKNRIRYYKNETNVGAVKLVDNWNKCLSLAKGEYIMIMGDDDVLEPDYLAEFLDLMSKYPGLHVYHCRSQIIDDTGKTQMLTPACPSFESVYDSIWHRLNQYRSNYISDYVYLTSALRESGGFYYLPLAWGTDDITAFIASATHGIAHSNKPVFKYRSHGMSISSTTSNDLDKMIADEGYAKWLEGFLQKSPTDADAIILHRHLVLNQKNYMHKRKIFTLSKVMVSDSFKKLISWLKNRSRFGLSVKDVLLAFAKSQNMKRKATSL
ncbi:glycosyltransferase family 2 protein [Aquiflexum sp. TKW24L]|uniref:glycosyltransferase family 2 protein n=1 Tax=Aquiflexum sp. TKW24L TaxID=2942212 RepID=UPI0020BEF192|nr:glycosyltransferase family 2 protein [Aquiflexum sp. TKW24L]MCL6260678.1 glycosyltransferase family 2 protein [Aquiflexum sp. TKW24L]